MTKGSVTSIAMANEASRVEETTIGTGLINSPIIPVAKSKGINAQTVVMVVVKIGAIKSRHTSSPVCKGVNFPLRKYAVMAEITTTVSSTSNPSDKSKEKNAINDKSMPVSFITVKV